MRTVEELEMAGVAGLSIEDTLLPQAYGTDAQQILSPEEGLTKAIRFLDSIIIKEKPAAAWWV